MKATCCSHLWERYMSQPNLTPPLANILPILLTTQLFTSWEYTSTKCISNESRPNFSHIELLFSTLTHLDYVIMLLFGIHTQRGSCPTHDILTGIIGSYRSRGAKVPGGDAEIWLTPPLPHSNTQSHTHCKLTSGHITPPHAILIYTPTCAAL